MACDPTTLADAARCIECAVPPGMELAVLIVIAQQLAGNGQTPEQLVAGAACLACSVPAGMQMPVLIALACSIAGQ